MEYINPNFDLCATYDCPIKKNCLRAVAKDNPRQVYSAFSNQNKNCEYFVPAEKYPHIRKKESANETPTKIS